jgi:opacity protein-like surface antigen
MRSIGVFAACVLASTAAIASAQESGATVSASIAATNMDSRTELTLAGSFGYRFTRTVGLDVEATYVPSLSSPFPGATIQNFSTVAGTDLATSLAAVGLVFPGPTFSNSSGRLVVVSNNIRIELPTTAPRLTPYFVAGGGVANVRRRADIAFPFPLPLATAIPIRPVPQPISFAETDLALTLGGGLNVRIVSRVSVDADLRFFRLLGDEDRNVGRFGAGVRYRF